MTYLKLTSALGDPLRVERHIVLWWTKSHCGGNCTIVVREANISREMRVMQTVAEVDALIDAIDSIQPFDTFSSDGY